MRLMAFRSPPPGGGDRGKQHELQHQPGFAATFLPDGAPPAAGSRFTQPALAQTLSVLSEQGLESFYRGELAHHLAREMGALGMPITLDDLHRQRAGAARRCTSRTAKAISGT